MKILVIVFLLTLISTSCQSTEEIDFIKNGATQFLELNGLEENSDGYLTAKSKFSLSSEKALYGDESSVSLKLSFFYNAIENEESGNNLAEPKSLAGTEWLLEGSVGDEESYLYKFKDNGEFLITVGQAEEGFQGKYEQEGVRVILRAKGTTWEGKYDGKEFTVSSSNNRINILIGDNLLTLSDIKSEESESGIFLRGPSINWTENLGELSEFITPDTPFDLTVTYDGSQITYAINGKEIYSNTTNVPPEGTIRIDGYSSRLRLYNLTSVGQYKSVAELYTKEFMIDRAMKSTAAAAEKVKDDPNRPAFHFQPPANWNNDPNGMMYYDGYYHMFYQYNPYSDVWNWMHWGHARSRDMVHWEHLPVALWPSLEKGEWHCFSGSAFIKDDGKPILFYTSIGHENPEHWAAVPVDDQLIDWEKHPANPIVVMEDHGGQLIDEWRDPFLFREGGNTYMVIGGHPRGAKGSIMMYKALNAELTDWKYIGSPFEGQEGNWECPNFFKVGDKYVLIYSPHGQVEYYTGTLDVDNVKFNTEYHGLVDNGSDWNYYAPNTLQKDDGRRLLFGWIGGFKLKQGWQGVVSIPRELSVDSIGRLIQTPIEEINKLRGNLIGEQGISLANKSRKLQTNNAQFDMEIKIKGDGASNLGLRFNDEEGNPYEIVLTPQNIFFGEEQVKVDPELDEKIKSVRLLFDRTVVEIFVNGGLLCATEVIYPHKKNPNFEIFNRKERIEIESINIWEMDSIWKK